MAGFVVLLQSYKHYANALKLPALHAVRCTRVGVTCGLGKHISRFPSGSNIPEGSFLLNLNTNQMFHANRRQCPFISD